MECIEVYLEKVYDLFSCNSGTRKEIDVKVIRNELKCKEGISIQKLENISNLDHLLDVY